MDYFDHVKEDDPTNAPRVKKVGDNYCQCCGTDPRNSTGAPEICRQLRKVNLEHGHLSLCAWCHEALRSYFIDPYKTEVVQPMWAKLEAVEAAMEADYTGSNVGMVAQEQVEKEQSRREVLEVLHSAMRDLDWQGGGEHK